MAAASRAPVPATGPMLRSGSPPGRSRARRQGDRHRTGPVPCQNSFTSA